ncbi:hypothetical protein BD410DRAFT_792143 [Rickenella mellea]|uniref:Uncharacterized protein n=1 Tax=Rickenella mellea TaxID=50990 RepID=A0A4Y7PG34_9AGAM|nr:hypothetical protein BD410DRAFT_797252 [Rickenella mellea]TDL19518.1 hypothetical protein BD410DRAFT_792143 [Rickenella mellea]
MPPSPRLKSVEEHAQLLHKYQRIATSQLLELQKDPERVQATYDRALQSPDIVPWDDRRWMPKPSQATEFLAAVDEVFENTPPNCDDNRMKIACAAFGAVTFITLEVINKLPMKIRHKVSVRQYELSKDDERQLALQLPSDLDVHRLVTALPTRKPYASEEPPPQLHGHPVAQCDIRRFLANPDVLLGKEFVKQRGSPNEMAFKVDSFVKSVRKGLSFKVIFAGQPDETELSAENMEEMLRDSVID